MALGLMGRLGSEPPGGGQGGDSIVCVLCIVFQEEEGKCGFQEAGRRKEEGEWC